MIANCTANPVVLHMQQRCMEDREKSAPAVKVGLPTDMQHADVA